MATISPLAGEPPLLLFCDTFSHQENEEMHLDLVSFPRPVAIQEVRVIPAGHRVHAAISDREKIGETHPSSFKLDMFIRNLDNPGAVVFERLGVLDYKEPNHFQITAAVKAATDVVVLRGWYTHITISLYGYFTEIARPVIQEARPDKHAERPTAMMDVRPAERLSEAPMERLTEKPERGYQRTYERSHDRGPPDKVPERVERRERGQYERGMDRTEYEMRRDEERRPRGDSRDLDNNIRAMRKDDARHRNLDDDGRSRGLDIIPEERRSRRPRDEMRRQNEGEGRDRRYLHEDERRSRSRDRAIPKSPPPKRRLSRESPEKVTATVGESTAAKPTTPPGSPREEAVDSRSASPSDDLFEPLTPDHSPNMFLSDEGADDDEQDAYEEILSDEEDMNLDDATLEEAGVQFGDLDLYSEDAWMSVSVSFNPYQCDLSPLTSFPVPDQNEHEATLLKFKDPATTETAKETGEKLVELVEMCKACPKNTKWVEVFEEIPPLVTPGLAYVMRTKEDSDITLTKLIEWTMFALNMDEAMRLPIAINVRLLKAGLRMVYSLCSCGPTISALLINAGIQEKLHEHITCEHMSSSMKLHALQALDSCTDSHIGLEHYLGWDTVSKDEDDDDDVTMSDSNDEDTQTGYQKLMEFLLTDQTVRVVNAASALGRKVHFYELLASFQSAVERVIKSTAETAAAQELEAETEQEPGAEPKEPRTPPQVDYPMEIPSMKKPLKEDSLAADDIEIIAVALEEIYMVVDKANELIVQPPIKAFPTTAKITALGYPVKDPYPILFRIFAVRRLLESLVVLVASPVGCHPVVYCGIRDLIFLLLQTHQGLLFLSSHPEPVGGLIRVLTQTTESDIHHSEALPLQEFLRDSPTADLCTPQHLGLLLIYHLQALQAVDQLFTSLSNKNVRPADLDGADMLSTLHTLYSMTFTMIGKAAVIQVLSMDQNLSSLLPFVKPTGNPSDDVRLKKCVSSRYASVLISLTIKCSENVEMLSKLSSKLLAITEKIDTESPLKELANWLDPLRDLTFDTSSITKLVEYVQSKLSNLHTSHEAACGVLMALRVLKHLVCPEKDEQTKSQGHQKNLNVNLSIIQLFSANALDIFINTLQKLGEFILHPWRKGQSLATGHNLVTISMATPLLGLIKRMLTELLDRGGYQFKDTRLMTSLMLLHTVLCSAPMTGQLNSLAQQIQSDIVAIFMTFTRPIVQTSDHEEAINESIWSLMLKELFKYTMSTPQAFLGGLVLLSELLPVPLPMHTLEELDQEDISQVMNHRLLWSAHLNPLSSDLQGILKSLAASACHNLQQVLRRVCSQLADLSAPTAFNIVRTLLEVLDNEMTKPSEQDKKTCTADAVRIMALLAFLSSQPAVKIALLQLLKISRAGKNDDVMFPNLLPSMLAMLSAEPDVVVVSRAQYCVVSIIQSLCDPSVSLTSFVTPFTNQHLSNTLPDSEMLSVICTALLDHVGSTNQSFATILLALRSMVTLTEHNYGVYHLKRSLESNTEVFHRLLTRLSSSFETGIPGPDSLSTLSTTTELLQLLLPEEAIAEPSQTTDIQIKSTDNKPDITDAPDSTKPSDDTGIPESTDIKTEPGDNQSKPEQSEAQAGEVVKGEHVFVRSISVKKEEMFGLTDDAELKPTSEISVSISQMKTFLKAECEDDFPLRVLEKRLEESCKEDETLETLLDGITTLKQILEKGEDTGKENEEDKEPDLPSSHPFQQLFNDRVTFIAGDPEEGGVSPTLWFSTPPPDDIDPEIDLVNSDLEALRTKYCGDFDLAAELEKGVVPSPPSTPIRKKSRVVKRKFDPLIQDGTRDVKRFRGGYGRGRGRGMGRGRGRGNSDLFRSRKQNTSRPPSMHVDDFMAMEQQKGQDNMQNRRGGGHMEVNKGPMSNRPPMDRGGNNFNSNQNRWGGISSGPFRKGPGPQGMGRGGGTPDWISPRGFGGFPDQRGFQRGPNWSNPQQSQYRGGGFRDNQHNRPQGRGYWESPRTTKDIDGRFMTSPHVGSYRPGAGRAYPGKHMRSFTR